MPKINEGEHEPYMPVMDASPQQTAETTPSGPNQSVVSGTVSEPTTANLVPVSDNCGIPPPANSIPHRLPAPADNDPAPTIVQDDPAAVMRKLLKGKEEEWNAVSRRMGKLTLLELPLDVLRLIVNEASRFLVLLLRRPALKTAYPFFEQSQTPANIIVLPPTRLLL